MGRCECQFTNEVTYQDQATVIAEHIEIRIGISVFTPLDVEIAPQMKGIAAPPTFEMELTKDNVVIRMRLILVLPSVLLTAPQA
jgi:hypothetical protein